MLTTSMDWEGKQRMLLELVPPQSTHPPNQGRVTFFGGGEGGEFVLTSELL